MKKLKLDHAVAQRVAGGQQTASWRLYDDKDLTVNDEVALVDKLDPAKPASWRVIGRARIDHIIEKRVGDISENDYLQSGQEPVAPEERLRLFREYYGPQVSWDTPVKMVHFDFVASASEDDATSARGDRIGKKVILYADGGSRGNPGPSASGFVLLDEQQNVLIDKGIYLGITTNNQAEYQALKFGLEEASKMGAQEVDVRLDSLLVVNQMKGIFKIKNRELWPIHEAIKQLVAGFSKVSFTHVPRELNKLADAAVNRTLDEAKGNKED
jgi:ribonuclease HI